MPPSLLSRGRMRKPPRRLGMGARTKHRGVAYSSRFKGRKSFQTVKRTTIRGRPAFGIGRRRYTYVAKDKTSRDKAFRRAHRRAGYKTQRRTGYRASNASKNYAASAMGGRRIGR